MKKVAYTVLVNSYDELKPFVNSPDFDYICFTNMTNINPKGWNIVPLELWNDDPTRTSRLPKILPHKYLANYETSVYVDASIEILSDLNELIDIVGQHKHAAFRHCSWHTPMEEVQACIDTNKDDEQVMLKQMGEYFKDGYPNHNKLTANGVLVRKHMDQEVIDLNEDWWKEIETKSRRDQISFGYVAWKRDFEFGILPDLFVSPMFRKYFYYQGHRK